MKVIIVEDEFVIAETISNSIKEMGYDVLDPVSNFTEAIELIEEKLPDIGILDIQLAGKKTGIDLAQVINDKYHFPFIFLTSKTDQFSLQEAKYTEPYAFLVKPFNKHELHASVELALYNYSQRKHRHIESLNSVIKDCIFIKQKDQYIRLKLSDIVYLQSDSVYIDIYTQQNKVFTIRASLNEYIDQLDVQFMRIHRSYIINTQNISKVDLAFVHLSDKKIPIGKKYKEPLLKKLNIL